jgi:hypothetical protein
MGLLARCQRGMPCINGPSGCSARNHAWAEARRILGGTQAGTSRHMCLALLHFKGLQRSPVWASLLSQRPPLAAQ